MTRLRSKPKPCCGRTLCSCGKPPSLKRTPLQRGKPLERSGRINAVSAKRRRENGKRREVLREKYGTAPVVCERCKQRPADDAHELLPRAQGGSITDPTNIRMICRPCHQHIHANPDAAYASGWLKHSWED